MIPDHSPRRRTFAFAAALALVWTGWAIAQPAEPAANEDALARLIREHEAQRATIERPLLAAYAQRLVSLLDTLEKRRDPAAREVDAELDAVQAALQRGPSDPAAAAARPAPEIAAAAPLELPGRKALTSGGASAIGDDNSLVHFAGKDSAAEWSLPKLPPGRYRILWRIACDVGAGATARLLIDGQPPRTLEIVPTSASGDTRLVNLGEFSATTAPAWVRVEVVSVPGSARTRRVGPSFSVSQVILIPPGVTMPGL